MKTIVFIIAVLLCCSIYSQEKKDKKQKEEKKVYICNSMTSDRYHYKKNCPGIKRCTDSIIKVSIKKAKASFGRTVCGFETHLEDSKSKN